MKIRILAALLTVVATGCATLPVTGAPATGEPLEVDSRVVTDAFQVKEKVAEVQHKDSQGRSLGTSDVYQNRTVYQDRMVWTPVQGRLPIDDQDFFRIAGDVKGEEEIRSYRETGIVLNRTGLGILAASAASVIGGIAIGRSTGGSPAASGMMYGGLFGVSIGSIVSYVGLGRFGAGVHPLDAERARVAATKYNQGLAEAAEAARLKQLTEAKVEPASAPSLLKAEPGKKIAAARRARK